LLFSFRLSSQLSISVSFSAREFLARETGADDQILCFEFSSFILVLAQADFCSVSIPCNRSIRPDFSVRVSHPPQFSLPSSDFPLSRSVVSAKSLCQRRVSVHVPVPPILNAGRFSVSSASKGPCRFQSGILVVPRPISVARPRTVFFNEFLVGFGSVRAEFIIIERSARSIWIAVVHSFILAVSIKHIGHRRSLCQTCVGR
jgi:hypothetical protein